MTKLKREEIDNSLKNFFEIWNNHALLGVTPEKNSKEIQKRVLNRSREPSRISLEERETRLQRKLQIKLA